MVTRSMRNRTMRFPDEGAPTGAGPGTGDRANVQRLEDEMVQERLFSQRAQPVPRTQNRNSSTINHQANAAPANVAVADRRQSLTLAGCRRQRIMWTREMNHYVRREFGEASSRKSSSISVGLNTIDQNTSRASEDRDLDEPTAPGFSVVTQHRQL
uniref:Uncharacterized protein n=1 Tax=Anopheles quadriannulatus TaxID=34691 RepID=A0A182X1R3_ANOQN